MHTGPQRRATQVHALDLPGCTLYRRTTAEALADAPAEIRAYLDWLAGHGEEAGPRGPVRVAVAEESLSGGFIGAAGPAEDLEPLRPRDLARYARWLEWGRADLLALAEPLGRGRLDAAAGGGRTVRAILEHVLGADKAYVYAAVGVTKEVGDPTNAALAGRADLFEALREARAAAVARLRRATAEERSRVRQGGATTYTLRRCVRAMLSHEWQHRREIEARLSG